MRELREAGTAQNRKVYKRHGVSGKMYGVSYAALGKLKKRIKVDQPLAEKLWETGNQDARTLATMVADPASIKLATLQSWAKEVDNRGLAAAVSNVAGDSPHAQKLADRWIRSRDEMIGCAGWHTLATVARQDKDLKDDYFEERLERIESTVHTSKNWVRYAMNNALINIGVRNSKLEKKSIAAAKRIGAIDVDHGETRCKTPAAAAYIKKTLTHLKKKTKA
jgi:3-methyladenine DNA glycosylase AlkD